MSQATVERPHNRPGHVTLQCFSKEACSMNRVVTGLLIGVGVVTSLVVILLRKAGG